MRRATFALFLLLFLSVYGLCPEPVEAQTANRRVCDFICTACAEEYELKSQNGKLQSIARSRIRMRTGAAAASWPAGRGRRRRKG